MPTNKSGSRSKKGKKEPTPTKTALRIARAQLPLHMPGWYSTISTKSLLQS